jgi:hypothetical protein
MSEDFVKPEKLRVGTFWQIDLDRGDRHASNPFKIVSVAPDGKSGEAQRVDVTTFEPCWDNLFSIKLGRVHVTVKSFNGMHKLLPWEARRPNFYAHQSAMDRAFQQNPAAALAYLDTIKADIERYMAEVGAQAPIIRKQEEPTP